MARLTSNFTPSQLSAVHKVDTMADIVASCRQNFNGLSACYAGVSFNDVSISHFQSNPLNYTIVADAGLIHIDVEHHTGDIENRILPLQWAIDKAIIELRTDQTQQTPLQWPYTMQSNKDQTRLIRLSYTRGIREIIVLAFFLAFSAISYQIPGSVANERALLITGHMKAMGLYDSARILSWHVGISITYLPGWIIVGLLWKFRIFVETSAFLIVFVHVLLGLVLASWSLFVAAPFGTSPQLAAVVTTFLSVAVAVIGQTLNTARPLVTILYSALFPPSFYIFAMKAICGYENNQLATNPFKGDPDRNITLFPFIFVAILNIFVWPCLAVRLERKLYETISPKTTAKKQEDGLDYIPPNVAISIRNLTKVYSSSVFASTGDVTAVSNLSLDIPKTGIFVLLGSNGAGKSTTLSILAGLSSITEGTVTFEGGFKRPPRGTMGIVPQKNVLFDELTCLQTLEVWRAVKWSHNTDEHEDLEQLLIDCDLEKKIHANAATLSGGQKRKLQLAIGLLGGSKVVLVDECTSGVDPLSRRALWKILTAFHEDRSIVFTTHFLDEADLLADQIAILAAPGKVVASGTPVSLKRDFGDGYSVQVSFKSQMSPLVSEFELLEGIKQICPQTYITSPSSSQKCYHLRTRDNTLIGQVLEFLDTHVNNRQIESYDLLGTTIEDVFLDVMSENDANKKGSFDGTTSSIYAPEDLSPDTPLLEKLPGGIGLTNGRSVSPFRQAFTVFHKRALIAKRAWMTPFLAIFITVIGACVPLTFIKGKDQSCTVPSKDVTSIPLYLPKSTPLLSATLPTPARVVSSPPNIIESLGQMPLFMLDIINVPDNASFVGMITSNHTNITSGGVSVDQATGASLVAWEATSPGIRGPSMLNLATNVLFNRARKLTGSANAVPNNIYANYATFPKVAAATLVYLKWIFFFGAVMAVYPAFFALYVSKERRSSVQAMQLSNGLTNPVGMWLGHLMFDLIAAVLLSTIIIIVFASFSEQFHGLGLLWVVFLLYGISGTLFAYALSLMVDSALAAFAIVACYQFITFVLYLSSYLAVFTFGKITESTRLITIIHFTISIVSPVTSVVFSTNLFSLLCDSGTQNVTTASLFSITRFGGPILYLIIYAFVSLGVLIYVDSGSKVRHSRHRKKYLLGTGSDTLPGADVVAAAEAVATSDDLLRVINLSKSYHGKRVTDDVSLGVPRDSIFALLGPNGAGKTTTFNIIRGDVYPDCGDVIINGASIVSDPRGARASLGVCPQFTAIDSQLTVREHLMIYGRFKGLKRGAELNHNINMILKSTSLTIYSDRLASNLSGGNQRKLALAIALMGNPSVILIDEFSTGVDPKMKRDMWNTLRRVSIGKAIIITTHSMEEASALANTVGILAKRMLAIGTIEDLASRYGAYEVHFSCRSRQDVIRARQMMSRIPGSKKSNDVATRFEVPVNGEFSLAQLFTILASEGDFMEYTVERASLESIFLKVVRGAEQKESLFQFNIPSNARAFTPLRRTASQ
ncbi:ABC transporter A family member 6 [Psilocybe cubensis]|uniref:ABC transporter A family member 6 n=1 Tax=Psilocybe cubensis TaxID=181762 RepID=A0ACB8HEC0_PSICU|nr:ABC transporter A family member 6 [Psilocybe cubensis]KAH9486075.1 ABC transporter A family member 6 [Psilocybe cubensis]